MNHVIFIKDYKDSEFELVTYMCNLFNHRFSNDFYISAMSGARASTIFMYTWSPNDRNDFGHKVWDSRAHQQNMLAVCTEIMHTIIEDVRNEEIKEL